MAISTKAKIVKNSTLENIFPENVIREIKWKMTKTSGLDVKNLKTEKYIKKTFLCVIHFNNTDASLIRETEPFFNTCS